MNYCYEDIIKNKQKDYKNVEYGLSNLYAAMDIGKERKTQQDSILILQHPIHDFLKLIAVADGMGGLEDGAIASNLALLKLSKWFLTNLNVTANPNIIKDQIYNLIDNIDLYIRNVCNGGTTIAFAIVFKYYTMFFNIGDSRIYVKKNNDFYQLSKDHSITWDLYEKGIIKEKDNMRFHKKNNLILSRLGCKSRLLEIDYKLLSNNSYDDIYLFTDGVTDCLSDMQLYNIVFNSVKKDTLTNIIKNANNVISYKNALLTDEYYDRIIGGKDNISVIKLKNE